ncbi:hypothetical protein SRHO_G00015550 [Serrasalmus rhombeus]
MIAGNDVHDALTNNEEDLVSKGISHLKLKAISIAEVDPQDGRSLDSPVHFSHFSLCAEFSTFLITTTASITCRQLPVSKAFFDASSLNQTHGQSVQERSRVNVWRTTGQARNLRASFPLQRCLKGIAGGLFEEAHNSSTAQGRTLRVSADRSAR